MELVIQSVINAVTGIFVRTKHVILFLFYMAYQLLAKNMLDFSDNLTISESNNLKLMFLRGVVAQKLVLRC